MSDTADNLFRINAPHGGTIEIETAYTPDNDPYRELTTPEALRTYYDENGYVVLRNLVPAALCDTAAAAFRREVKPYSSFLYRQASANPEKHIITEHGYMLNSLLNVQDLDQNKFGDFRNAGMGVLTDKALQEKLTQIMGEAPKLVQSMYFEGNPATWAHQDSYYLDSAQLGRMVGAWFAVEDIAPGAGRFYIYPGSHLIDLAKNGGDFDVAFHHSRYKQLVIDIIHKFKLECRAPALRKGDVLLWGAKTIHGSLEWSQPQYSRSSFTGHYIPESTAFLQFQSREKALNLRTVNDMLVNFPKDQNEFKNRAVFFVETTFPKAFRLAKKMAIKAVTR